MKINEIECLSQAAFLLRAALIDDAPKLLDEIARIDQRSPFRKMTTRRGVMSVAMTNCGEIGWLSDRRGYRYTKIDPLSEKNWPQMADWLKDLAIKSAEHVGFPAFNPNVCLINKYTPGTRLGQHIDKDEGDWMSPIVAFSFGLPALFRWGGLQPRDPADDFLVKHGDILVWGGEIVCAITALPKFMPLQPKRICASVMS